MVHETRPSKRSRICNQRRSIAVLSICEPSGAPIDSSDDEDCQNNILSQSTVTSVMAFECESSDGKHIFW